ncbi:MAG TPA: VOC family protein [Candidatus Dormibacteraeota bacterium]|nr:VOC family protein [Candidatus Dormibacteraeota bacterium]
MTSRLCEIVVDCADAELVGRFWSDVLGWPLVSDPEGYCWLSATGAPDALPLLVFVGVPEPKSVKNRVHLDIRAEGSGEPDELAQLQAAELDRLVALGARRIDVGQGEVPWVVLADPEGNEFCLLGPRLN